MFSSCLFSLFSLLNWYLFHPGFWNVKIQVQSGEKLYNQLTGFFLQGNPDAIYLVLIDKSIVDL